MYLIEPTGRRLKSDIRSPCDSFTHRTCEVYEMDKRTRSSAQRPEMLENAPMQYAPMNELGVVFLFSHIARRLRLKIEQIRPQYPDCIAYQKTGNGEKQVRIEFEYKSRNFYAHRH